MRPFLTIIKDMKNLKHAVLPMYRMLTQVYADDKRELWDLIVSHDIVLRAVKKDWTHLSNVCTDRMTPETEISVLFQDEDDLVRSDIDDLTPAFYKVTLKKARPEDWSTDIKLTYYYSHNGDKGPWMKTDNYLIKRRIRDCCTNVIMDKEDNVGRIKIDDFIYEQIKFFGKDERSDFTLILPWLILDGDMYGRTIIIDDPFDDTCTNRIISFFNTYIECNKEGNYIMTILTKKEQLNMASRATIIHKGMSHEYPYEPHETSEERIAAYKRYLEDILSS